MSDNKAQQAPKPEHEDQGKHLGQQKQQAGEIGKDAQHGKSEGDRSNEVEDDDEQTDPDQ